ncbi:hypothetical protein CH333_09745 [candidate division WOR-3 bacterium JGI_Cruoil_03_44_89]|uniref:Uncharacterized protein n=1 Tax=candidate division WOR-3 bacterium JGI_Cruoil_03_44_89 TaxID=1973748 RepID=A0A235BMY0_UNCW3|nr:MAG: hypothetical protein CH333_09745 [candidate division WOR-3 bacterium JGI_Cruoil_03_44_89]
MNIFRKLRWRKNKEKSTTEKQEVFRRLVTKKTETFVGICPFCGASVTFEMEDDIEELILMCTSCKRIIFYLDKLHTPPQERNLEDLRSLSVGDID